MEDRREPHPGEPGYRSPGGGTLDRALELVRFLRVHCAWDAEQTARSLVPHLLEETHEVVDAIRDDDGDALEGELGDLLLNLAFQIVVAEEEGRLTAESVTRHLEEKMRRRHPHLYGLGEKEAWEALKAREARDAREARRGRSGEEETPAAGILDGLARGLDPLTAAHRIQDRVAGVGFDWADFRGAWEKVGEELDEVREALEGEGPEEEVAEELGDLLFAAVNLARLGGAHAADVLDRANRKFRRRFEALEAMARERGIVLGEASLAELDALWDELKAREPRSGGGADEAGEAEG